MEVTLYDKVLDITKYLAYPFNTMAKIRAVKTDPERQNEPIHLSDHAIENLQFIRETMERSTHFTAVPGYGGMLMGITAIVTAYISMQQIYRRDWLIAWLIEACL